jgi:tetratricopeptide (TPR) repeat protein
MNKLTGPEKTIMKQLGAFKMPGISAEDFCEFTSAGAAHDQTLALSLGPVHEQREHIDGLVRKGWVEQYGKYLMLHPVIGDIVMAWNWTAEYRTAEQAMMQKLVGIIRHDYKSFLNFQNEAVETVETNLKGHKTVGSDRIGEYISLAEQSLEWYPFSDKFSQKLKYQMISMLPQSEEDKVLKQSKDLLKKGKYLDLEELIDLHYQIAYIYEQQNKMAASYREVKKASVLVSKVTDPLIKAEHYFWLACGAKENGDFEKAMNLLYQAEETAYNAGTDQGMQKYALYLTRDIHWLLEKVDISSLREEDIESVLTEISNIIDEYHVTDIDTISSYYMELCKHQCYAGIDDKIVLETMEKGAAAMQRLSTSDYFYIDNVILFKFDVYQALLMYDEARKVLEEGVELCNRYADMLPYIRKKLDLLLDLACVYHNIRQPSMAKKYYDQIAEILENTDGLRMSQEFISDYETYRL